MRVMLLLLVWSGIATAQPAPGLDRETSVKVLWGRFSIQLPKRMVVVPNPRDSFGLALPAVLATRAELDDGDGKFVMVVTDTLAHVQGDFSNAVTRELAITGVGLDKLTQDEHLGFWAVHVDPPLPRNATDPNLVHATYVRGADGRATVFAFYLFGRELRAYAGSWARLARDATATIGYHSDAGLFDRESTMMLGDKRASATAPSSWFVFSLYGDRLRTEGLLLRELGRLGWKSRTCVVDNGVLIAPRGARPSETRWLGKPATWRSWQTKSDHQAEIEVKFGDVRAHAWCTAPTAEGLREAQRIVGEMTVQ
jgi:hypothetical protein